MINKPSYTNKIIITKVPAVKMAIVLGKEASDDGGLLLQLSRQIF